jgi:hypothetical protein
MTHEITTDAPRRMIRVRHWDDVTLKDLQEARRRLLELMEETGFRRVVSIYTDATSIPSIPEIFHFVAEAFQVYPGNSELAFVTDQSRHLTETTFAENVGVNRGVCLKAFKTEPEAIAWLLGDACDEPPAGEA